MIPLFTGIPGTKQRLVIFSLGISVETIVQVLHDSLTSVRGVTDVRAYRFTPSIVARHPLSKPSVGTMLPPFVGDD